MTPPIEQLTAMTDDDLRVRAAEACGWKSILPWSYPPDIFGIAPVPRMIGPGLSITGFDPVPNYPADLNACAQFERTMSEEQWDNYERCLLVASGAETREQGPIDWRKAVSATARQRCIAFLAL